MNSSDFEHIAQSVRPHLVKIGRKFFGDSARAEDVAQEVLVRLWALRHFTLLLRFRDCRLLQWQGL